MIAAALALALAATAAAPAPHLTDWREIPLRSGVNPVAHMLPDGRDGLIVRAYPHTETAGQSRTDYMVLAAPTKDDNGDWTTVRFAEFRKPDPNEAEPGTTVSDAPHTGEDALSSVRFFRARVDGAPAVLAVKTQRDFVLPIPDASHAVVDVFRLEIEPDFGEETFKRVARLKTRACYGHSDAGAFVEFGVPLSSDYAGPRQAAPCGKP